MDSIEDHLGEYEVKVDDVEPVAVALAQTNSKEKQLAWHEIERTNSAQNLIIGPSFVPSYNEEIMCRSLESGR